MNYIEFVRMLNRKIDIPRVPRIIILVILISAPIYLWLYWPIILKYYYKLVIWNPKSELSVSNMGTLGDSFGVLTSLFTLFALLFSAYTNFLQYRQFRSISRLEGLAQARFFKDRLFSDKDIYLVYLAAQDNKIMLHSENAMQPLEKYQFYLTLNSVSGIDDTLLMIKALNFVEEYLTFVETNIVERRLTVVIDDFAANLISNSAVNRFLRGERKIEMIRNNFPLLTKMAQNYNKT